MIVALVTLIIITIIEKERKNNSLYESAMIIYSSSLKILISHVRNLLSGPILSLSLQYLNHDILLYKIKFSTI